MIRRALSQFMVGRYGADQLNFFLLVAYLVITLLNMFTRWGILNFLGLVLLILCMFRMLSRNVEKRRAENTKFLQATGPMIHGVRSFRLRMTDKEHKYFKCPGCGQQMRVPRGKGRITVHCRNCGLTFEEKS